MTTHSLAVHATFEREVTAQAARALLAAAPGVEVIDDLELGQYPTPADVVGTDPTYVGRIRRASTTRACSSSSSAATTCARAQRSTRCRSRSWSPPDADPRSELDLGERAVEPAAARR